MAPDPRVAASFARQGLMATLGARIVEVGDGACVIEAPIDARVTQHHGVGHAGLTFALGDTAAGYAAQTRMPEGSEVVTIEMKVNLIAPARGERLRATGRVVRAGRRLTVVTAEVEALAGEERRVVAILQGTMMPVAAG